MVAWDDNDTEQVGINQLFNRSRAFLKKNLRIHRVETSAHLLLW